MQLQLSTVLAALAVVPAVVHGASAYDGDRTLVILDQGTNQAEYSIFLDDLKQRGLDLEIVDVKTGDYEIQVDGENEYDNLLIFPTKVKSLGPKLNAQRLLEFFNAGGNILALTSTDSSPESVREFLNELDIAISPRGYKAVDHFNYDKEQGPLTHDVLSIEGEFSTPKVVAGNKKVLYKGGAAYLGNSNAHVVPILHGSSTGYAYDISDDGLTLTTPWASGTQMYLIAGFQGNNNARVGWVGSSDMFSNKFFEASADNREVAQEVSKWVFQEKGVLKIEYAKHEGVNETQEWSTTSGHALYHVNQLLSYSASVSEWTGEAWVPFVTDDLQMEFVMLDPYYRLTFGEPVAKTETGAVYEVEFKAPDQYGIFTFKLDYERPGFTFLRDHQVVTVRHTANDEWPRGWEITNSWVYMSSFATVLISWLLFVVFYLYSSKGGAEAEELKEKKDI